MTERKATKAPRVVDTKGNPLPLTEARKARLREFADLFRGGPDHLRGNRTKCYAHLHPRAKKSTCEVGGSQWFNHPFVQGYLAEKAQELTEQADVTEAMVLAELRNLAFFNSQDLFYDDGTPIPLSQLPRNVAAAIVGVDVVRFGNKDAGIGEVIKLKLADKKGSLELFGRNLRMWHDKVDMNVSGGKSLAELAKQAQDESQ